MKTRQMFKHAANIIHAHPAQHVWIQPMVQNAYVREDTREMDDFLRVRMSIKPDPFGHRHTILALELALAVMYQLDTKCHPEVQDLRTLGPLDLAHRDLRTQDKVSTRDFRTAIILNVRIRIR